MAGTLQWAAKLSTTAPLRHDDALGLDAGRKAKACQGLAACTTPSTLDGADVKENLEARNSPAPSIVLEGNMAFQTPPQPKPNC